MFVKPLILWLWIGGGLMAVGTLLAAFPGRRRRRPTDPVSAPIARPALDRRRPRSSSSRRDVLMRARRVAPFVALAVAVVMAGLFVVLLGSDPPDGESAQTNLMDQPAPEARGELADGTAFQLSRRKGDWVVLNFFQSSCVPCQEEHPELVEFVDAQQALARRRPLLLRRLRRLAPERRGLLRPGGRRLAGRLRRGRLDRRRVRRVEGARDVDHRSGRRRSASGRSRRSAPTPSARRCSSCASSSADGRPRR